MSEDAAFIAALRRRESDALSSVFEQNADRLYRLAVSLLHDEQQADGVVQNTFLALIEHIDQFEARASISTWLYRVAYNDCLQRVRRAKPEVELLDEDEAPMMPACFVDWQNVPEAVIGGEEASDEMERAINRLKPELRAVFLLRDVEELSTEEAAQALGITPGAVKVRLHRARLALREMLATYFAEWVRE